MLLALVISRITGVECPELADLIKKEEDKREKSEEGKDPETSTLEAIRSLFEDDPESDEEELPIEQVIARDTHWLENLKSKSGEKLVQVSKDSLRGIDIEI